MSPLVDWGLVFQGEKSRKMETWLFVAGGRGRWVRREFGGLTTWSTGLRGLPFSFSVWQASWVRLSGQFYNFWLLVKADQNMKSFKCSPHKELLWEIISKLKQHIQNTWHCEMEKRNLWRFKYFDNLKQSHRKPGLNSGSLKKTHRLEAEFCQYSYLPGKDIILRGWPKIR